MDIYQTKERIENFLGEVIDHYIPDQYAKVIHRILDKAEGVTNDGNEPTADTESASTTGGAIVQPSAEPESQSDSKPTEGTDGSNDDATTEPTTK